MKKKKWVYLVALAVIALAALLLCSEQASTQLPVMILSVIIGLAAMFGVALLACWVIKRNRRREEDFRAAAEAITGRVIKIERLPVRQKGLSFGPGQPLYLLRAQYDYNGKRYVSARRSYFGLPPYEIGDPITVYVDPKDPTKSKILPDISPEEND